MNGKQHVAIGTVLGVGTCAYLTYNSIQLGEFNSLSSILDNGKVLGEYLGGTIIPVLGGSIIGSWLPDIDTKKSKAAQIFNKMLIALIVIFAGLVYFNNPIVNGFVESGKNSFLANTWLLVFITLTVMGYLSAHRRFTHRWVGTVLFLVSAYFIFSEAMFFGFAIGYISHILADRTTPAGKHLKFLKIDLPMTNSKGRFKIYN